MKIKFLPVYVLALALAVTTSCKQPVGDTSGATVTSSNFALKSKRIVEYNKTNTNYFNKITNYGDSLLNIKSYEIFDYTDFNFTTQLGTFTSTVSKNADGTDITESSITTVKYEESLYKALTEVYKYTDGVKEEKAYYANYVEALDADLTLRAHDITYSPKDSGKVSEMISTAFDKANSNRVLGVATYYTDELTCHNGIIDEDKSTFKFETINLYEYASDGTIHAEYCALLTKDSPTTKEMDLTASYYSYNQELYGKNYTRKETYAAHLLNGYDYFIGMKSEDLDALDYEELPTNYECVTYNEFGSDKKCYPVTIAILNDQYEIESKNSYQYAAMPDSTTEYYPSKQRTWIKKSGQESNVTILEETFRTNKTYSKDSDGVLYLQEIIYADKDKYGDSSDSSGSATVDM